MAMATQIFLLLVGCSSIAAGKSADERGTPVLSEDIFENGLKYERSRFIPFSFNAPEVIHHNGSRARDTGPCYEQGYSCNGAYCCPGGSCAGTDQTCCGSGICKGAAVCCDNGSCAGTGQVCCGSGICDVGHGCCEGITCVSYSDTCCVDGSSCPGGYGCFSNDNSNRIFCSPTGAGTKPATSTGTFESTTSVVNVPTSPPTTAPAVVGSSSVYYYTYEYEWTTFFYVYEIESFTTYIVTTVWSATATDSDAASSSFDAIKATFTPTAPPTTLPGASTPSPSPGAQTAPTAAASTSSAGHTSVLHAGAGNSGMALSAKLRGGETLGLASIVGAAMMVIIL
ncbi:hypothetical protein V8E51_007616 [Hyaloscypha variabilis]